MPIRHGACWQTVLPPGHAATLTQHNCTALIEANDVETILADIDADYGGCGVERVGHGVLLVLAPLASFDRWRDYWNRRTTSNMSCQ